MTRSLLLGPAARANPAPRIAREPVPGLALRAALSDLTLRWAAVSLVALAMIELALLRLGLRSAVHIPGLAPIDGAPGLVAEAGRLAFSAATVLIVLLLISLVARAARRGRLRDLSAAVGIGLLLAGATGTATESTGDLTGALLSLGGLSLVLPRALLLVGLRGAGPLAGIWAGFVLLAMVSVLPLLDRSTPAAVLPIGEGLALAGAIAAPLLVPRATRSRRDLAAALGAGLLIFALLVGNPTVSKNLALWTFGIAGYFPAGVYALAAGSLAYAVLTAYRSGSAPVAAALLLITAGGVGLHNTYQTALVVAGIALIGECRRWPDPAVEEEDQDAVAQIAPRIPLPVAGS